MTFLSIGSRKLRRRMLWMLLGVLSLVAANALHNNPEMAERLYGNGLFPVVRMVFDFTTGLLPFPVFWIVAVLMIWRLWVSALRPLIRREVTGGSFAMGLLSTAGALIFLFNVLWGFNYARPDIGARLGLESPPLEMDELRLEFDRATSMLEELTEEHAREIVEHYELFPREMERTLRQESEQQLLAIGIETGGRVRGRLLAPKGILLCFNTAGVYVPFSGEGHVDAGLLPMQLPFTMSHEMMHAHGVTDEGDCNFLAFVACSSSDEPFIRYSGWLSYWRYVASEFRRGFPEEYKSRFEQLPDLVRKSLIDIRTNLDKYPEILPQVRNAVYDQYLKSHGVKEGLKSYSRMVRMVRAYHLEQSSGQE